MKNPTLKRGRNVSGRLYSSIKYKAAKRNIDFDISLSYVDDLFDEQLGCCYYTGLPIDAKTRGGITASLDRIDSNYGYYEGNVQWVATEVNFMKHTMSEQKFFGMIEKIYTKHLEQEKRFD